ncbi:hypothetical protein RND81_04G054800 [Saponaria officinalis]|uniref:Uncharacterized protein n=1 Tax=Saponaria officinalis TaxID=3572 RepID=A0AAW1LF38_SAPOF
MVACNTKRSIFGILIGASVLIVLELVRKFTRKFPKHCVNFEQVEEIEDKRGEKNVDMVSNIEGGDVYSEDEVKENVVLINEVDREICGNVEIVQNGNKNCFEVKINQLGKDNTLSDKNAYADEEKIWNTIISEIESLDRNYSIWPRKGESVVSSPARNCEQFEEMKNGDYCSEDINQSDKVKKSRKFWKKLVPKHIRKNKKNKYGINSQPVSVDCRDECVIEYDDNDIEDLEVTSSVSSMENEDEEEHCTPTIDRCNEIMSADDYTKTYVEMGYQKDKIMKWLIILIIPLVGLTSGRIFAFVLTVIGCFLFRAFKG